MTRYHDYYIFQYSLCRVVLMVLDTSSATGRFFLFQYSLCRVVLMVRIRLICILYHK